MSSGRFVLLKLLFLLLEDNWKSVVFGIVLDPNEGSILLDVDLPGIEPRVLGNISMNFLCPPLFVGFSPLCFELEEFKRFTTALNDLEF